jgi:hypothetical protein
MCSHEKDQEQNNEKNIHKSDCKHALLGNPAHPVLRPANNEREPHENSNLNDPTVSAWIVSNQAVSKPEDDQHQPIQMRVQVGSRSSGVSAADKEGRDMTFEVKGGR